LLSLIICLFSFIIYFPARDERPQEKGGCADGKKRPSGERKCLLEEGGRSDGKGFETRQKRCSPIEGQARRTIYYCNGDFQGTGELSIFPLHLTSQRYFMKALLTHEPISIKILKFLLKIIDISGFFKSTKM